MSWTPTAFARQLGSGLLSFPVTAFDDQREFDEGRYREHLAWQAGFDVAGLFAAGGTGEGFSLTPEEVERVVRVAVDEVGDRVPVVAPAMGGTATAVAQARSAQEAGAAGILLFPPYLTESGQNGLAARVSAVCSATDLGVVVYSRSNGVLNDQTVEVLADRHLNFVGFKDGVGDIEQLTRIYARLGERLTYIGGLPTAETFALPLLQLGMTTYSSAIFNFVPEFALDFYGRVRAGDRDGVYRGIREFLLPYLDIRNRVPGYAVSIVKAGLRVVGRDAGPVRAPLQDLTDGEFAELSDLVRRTTSGG
ncbi:5-dehydro-4-deoxyglucarate dehydratase [Actinospica robiniae]|uniref:5-dehydro-4-deoxyglucarate dehydratase n=1 Tax=Actinospica robiniae TaxID=304901 RepID=UPI000426CC7A|nr:5-dehydro-4-deoxyglucarate dehydratase [Actinospica robiniae]